ncbi:MAG: amidohydrolase family protein [Acidobacteriota bacterium]
MKRKCICLALFAIALSMVGVAGRAQGPEYDLIIRNGRVFDGSLRPAFAADIAIKDGAIVQVGPSIRGSAARTIDARGLHVSPGFIDLHTHVDRGMYFAENRACLNYLYQGVTSIVVGQCGSSAWNIFEQAEDQINRWSTEGIGPNAALLVGHGTVRSIVLGQENRAPTGEELARMEALVQQAMEQGASGLSTGLIYTPGSYARTDEVVELAGVIAPFGGIYHSHIRNENNRLLEAVQEAIDIGDRARVQVHISHYKVIGRENWGLVKESSRLIEEHRAKGKKITADQYPYRFSNNYPYSRLIPAAAWRGQDDSPRIGEDDLRRLFESLSGGDLLDLYAKTTAYYPLSDRHREFLDQLPRDRFVRMLAQQLIPMSSLQGVANERERSLFVHRMQDKQEAELIRSLVRENVDRTGAENLMIGICPDRGLEGKSLAEAARMRGRSVEDMAIELDLMDARIVPYRMSEEDIEYIMRKDYVGTGSDGEAPFFGIDLPHIRSYSTFLHKIKKYALDRKAVSLEQVIRSQTSLPAEIMNWKDRGWIKPGYRADIAVLDLDGIETPTSISSPHQYCKGVRYLLVNGEPVISEGRYTGRLPGQVLKLKKPGSGS